MSVIERLRNAFRGAKQRWGSTQMKRRLWNQEFRNGRWDSIESTPGDMVYPFVQKYCRGGSILDLGCGSGNTGCELDVNSYEEYTGVDIADAAIEKARQRSEKCNRRHKNRYAQSDITDYIPNSRYDVILFRESIYYIPRKRIKATLQAYSSYLKPGGVLIIRWHQAAAAEELLGLVRGQFSVIERSENPAGPVVLVLRP